MVSKLEEAAQDVERARKALARARRRLATHSRRADGPTTVLTGEWKRAQTLLAKRRASLLTYENVIGTGLGYRHKSGAEREEICIVVFVRKKLTKTELNRLGQKRLPQTLRDGKTRIGVDVVELRKFEKHDAGNTLASIGPEDASNTGTIGALGRDRSTGDAVLITAMHVTGQNTFTGPVTMHIPSPNDRATPAARGTLTGGTRAGVDAAKIRIPNVNAIRLFLPPIPIAGWRRPSNDVNTTVRMYGRTSKMLSGVVKFLNVDLVADGFPFNDALLVSIPTSGGDSGGSIVDNANLILGFLFGRAPSDLGDFRVFSPAPLVLDALGCDITPL